MHCDFRKGERIGNKGTKGGGKGGHIEETRWDSEREEGCRRVGGRREAGKQTASEFIDTKK